MISSKENLNNYKFILTSGCSYGIMPNVVIKPEQYLFYKNVFTDYKDTKIDIYNDIIVINLSLGSQSSDWQADSIIHVTNKLLEMGVESENIYCMVEWSQWHRFNVQPYNIMNLDLDKFQWCEHNPFHYYEVNLNRNVSFNNFNLFDFKELEITTSRILYNIGKIGERIYVNPLHMNTSDFKKLGDEFLYFIEKAQENEKNLMFENKVKTYLDNILRTQFYFKSKNIKYNFLFMQSALSEWRDFDGIKKHILNTDKGSYQFLDKERNIVFNKEYKKNNEQYKNIEFIMPETKNQINLLDLDKFWFYDKSPYQRGGIDEWTIDNMKEVGYIKLTYEIENLTPESTVCNFNQHPNLVAYLNLWNLVSKDCEFLKVNNSFLDYVNEKFLEDYNHDGYTKNHLTISKNEWYKINEKHNYL